MIFKNKYKIWLAAPHLSDKGYEKYWIDKAFNDNWIAPLGPNVDLFESELALYLEAPFVHAVNSGTSAIHLALKALNIEEGDLVICQNFTFAATAFPILYEKAKPIFVDSSIDSWNMDPDLLEMALKDHKDKIKAIIVVDIYGLMPEMDKIIRIASDYRVPIIEDAAEALGTRYHGAYAGTLTEIGTLSFNGNKIITTSSGGAVISNSRFLMDRVRYLSNQSRDDYEFYYHSEVGYNYRISNILAGVGLGQLEILKDRVIKKTQIYDYYKNELEDLPGIKFMPVVEGAEPNYWLSTIIVNSIETRDSILTSMERNRIQVRRTWTPLNTIEMFKKYEAYKNGISDYLFEFGISLPSDTALTNNQLDEVISIIKASWVL
jgi:dTDP-4-amino-4,6-dideoxygalactose transaminase